MLEPGNNGSMWHFFLCVKDRNVKSVRREACYTFPSLEREGDHPTSGGWWKVESSMLGYRKACKCSEFY